MRVISGSLRGLKLDAPDGMSTRPTTDRVKESMFNIIQGYLPRKAVLDLFGGSGALGIEALSRGCSSCVFVDTDASAIKVIKNNISKARLDDKSVILKEDVFEFLRKCTSSFDIVFLDPPYNKGLIKKVLDILCERKLISPDSVIVTETADGEPLVESKGFTCIKTKKYGKTVVSVYKLDTDGEHI